MARQRLAQAEAARRDAAEALEAAQEVGGISAMAKVQDELAQAEERIQSHKGNIEAIEAIEAAVAEAVR